MDIQRTGINDKALSKTERQSGLTQIDFRDRLMLLPEVSPSNL